MSSLTKSIYQVKNNKFKLSINMIGKYLLLARTLSCDRISYSLAGNEGGVTYFVTSLAWRVCFQNGGHIGICYTAVSYYDYNYMVNSFHD